MRKPPTPSRVRTRARRPGARGAVIIEALIVSSMMITILICSLYVHRLYQTKLRVMRESRAQAWRTAIAGCGEAVEPGSMSGNVGDLTGDSPGSDGSFDGWFSPAETSDQRSESVGTTAHPSNTTMNARNSVTCNELPSDGSSVTNLLDAFAGSALKD